MLIKRARQDGEQSTMKKAKEERESDKMVYTTDEQKKVSKTKQRYQKGNQKLKLRKYRQYNDQMKRINST